MVLFLFSLNMVELFPVRYRDCGQAPVPGTAPGEMQCAEGDCKLIQGRCQRPISVAAGDNVIEFDEAGSRIAMRLTRFEMAFVVVLIATATVIAGVGAYAVLNRLMPFKGGERPALDLILVMGTFALPFLAPFGVTFLSRLVSGGIFGIDAAFSALDYSEAGLLRSAGFVFVLLAVSAAVGLWWDWRRWLVAAAVFYVIFVVLFTTVFTNGNGLASGMVGSLSYWLEQQDVQRGSQPSYYYGLLVPLYEFLPLIGFLVAGVYVLVRGFRRKESQPDDAPEQVVATTSPPDIQQDPDRRESLSLEAIFVLFLLFWTVGTWAAYSFAGEKMPWLTTHFAVPMILLTGWVVGKLIGGADWRAILREGWILIVAVLVGFAALVQTVSPWLAAEGSARPFSGYGLGQLNTTMQFLSALLVLAVCLVASYWVWQRIGRAAAVRVTALVVLAVVAVLTIRTAWLFAYVNYDYASEFLVYAHSTPDVREVMEQVEDISRRTAGELSLDIGYTADGSYPFIWYLRNYPNASQLPNPPSRPDLEKPVIIAGDQEWAGIEPYLGDNYVCNQQNFLWWPMQDYYGLTWERIRHALTNPQMRAALWDIVLRRDFGKYEDATGKTVRLSEWPLRDRFRFCVRRDVLEQVWSESAGPIEVITEPGEVGLEPPDFAGLVQPTVADLVVSGLGPVGNLNSPHGMAIDGDGYIYVADTANHRVVKLSPDGSVNDTWDSTWWRGRDSWKPGCLDAGDNSLALGDGEFCEPWGISVGPDGNIYVADTWNHRIQIFSPNGEFLNKFGVFGQSGSSITSAASQFYGPRDVAVADNGNIYVTDTGNKRIQVFGPDYQFLYAFGGPGIVEGRLDEPVGLAIGLDSLIYVADTWNNRAQVFSPDGDFVREWPIVGWNSQSVVNKPYIALDSAGHVYVSDPEGPRILVFDDVGNPLAALGGPGNSIFQLPTGVILDSQDNLWVSDAVNQRLLRFPALYFGEETEEQP
jgi:streptogramin lyase